MIMDNARRKKQADKFLYKFGLLDKLKEYGEPHIVGSYCMNMMAWNDLDIYILNENMSLEKLYELSRHIISTYKPFWYEAKQETGEDGKTVWFHGFETTITGEVWNVDLWFFGESEIAKAKKYYADINEKTSKNPALKKIVISIKQRLIKRGQYGYGQYTSVDVYEAVIEHGVKRIDEFFASPAKSAEGQHVSACWS